jgi:hypothetical protein
MTGLRIAAGKSPTDYACFLVEYDGKIETFISTLDDLLACVQAAAGTLRALDRNVE